jgi:hypothetical protein
MKQTPGERIMAEFDGDFVKARARINRAIQRAQAKAWDEGINEIASCLAEMKGRKPRPNPYRKAKR